MSSSRSLIIGAVAVTLGALWYLGGVGSPKHPESTKTPPNSAGGTLVKNAKGISLFTKSYPVESPKATILLVHGFGEHCQRLGYQSLYERLNSAQYTVHAYDHQGHGLSGGIRAHVEEYNDYVDDFLQMVDHFSNGDEKFYVIAHSMGGLIVSSAAERIPSHVNGVIMTAPFLKLAGDIDNPVLGAIVGGLASIYPHMPVANEDLSKKVSRSPAAQKAYAEDPLVYHGPTRAHFASQVLPSGPKSVQNAKSFVAPLLVFHGTDDKITDFETSKAYTESVGSEDKTFESLKDFYHEPFEDPDVELFYSKMMSWLKQRVSV